MQLHEIKPKTKNKKSKTIGRGGKRGTYSGRGQKGQKSRAGRRIRPQLRDIIKKIPKKRGYKFKPVREKPYSINIKSLAKYFKEGEIINPLKLLKLGITEREGRKKIKIKILGDGNLDKKFIISGCEVSKSAKEKILSAGGTVLEK